ncbi:MAG: molybdopterin molybdenumtransferase MoeA [Streptosporangiales bacterium]|nr:molybdopterin molybdenumtransferase MoeA [Streptosporangiales bacterium]
MIPVDRHIERILSVVDAPLEPIELALMEAQGTVLAEEAAAPVSLPPFDNSAMDGYAVVTSDVATATSDAPVSLPVVADIAAGDTGAYAIRPGMCARIMTGAPLPGGADAVVPVEWTDGGVAKVRIDRAPKLHNAIRRAGEDVAAGTVVLRPGRTLGAGELGVLASVGRRTVRVHPRPRVVVLSTGAELVDVGKQLATGQIWDSNSYTLTAAASEVGALGYRHGFIGDEPALVLDTLEDLLVRADILITSGGVSMGAHDVVKEVLSRLGTVDFTKVAMQPGMPQGFGVIGEDRTPIFTLPGNPVSAYVSFQLFVRPAIQRMRGLDPRALPTVNARLTHPVRSPQGKRSFLRATLTYGGDGEYRAAPVTRQGSHQLSALAETDALVIVPEEVTELAAGVGVKVLRLPRTP